MSLITILMPLSRSTPDCGNRLTSCYTIIMVWLRSGCGDTVQQSFKIALTFIAQLNLFRPHWLLRRLYMTPPLKNLTQPDTQMKVVMGAMGMPQLEVGLGRCWIQKETRQDGMSMMLCFICGETHRQQKNVIARNRRRALSVWSSGDRGCLQFQPDCFLAKSLNSFNFQRY